MENTLSPQSSSPKIQLISHEAILAPHVIIHILKMGSFPQLVEIPTKRARPPPLDQPGVPVNPRFPFSNPKPALSEP